LAGDGPAAAYSAAAARRSGEESARLQARWLRFFGRGGRARGGGAQGCDNGARGGLDGGSGWRPWRPSSFTGSKHGREGERQGEERKKGGGASRCCSSWRPGKSPGAHLGGQSGEQEVATPVSWEPPRTCFSKKTTHKCK
jgi:hypothetical protein